MAWRDRSGDAPAESLLLKLLNRPAVLSPTNALLLGIAWLIIGAILGWYFHLVPTSVVSYTWGDARLLWHVVFALVSWISSTVLLFAVGVLINRHINLSEIFGRMLYAHWPITLLMLPGVVDDKVAYSTFMESPMTAFGSSALFASFMSLLFVVNVIWYLYWGYCAFSRSAKRDNILVLVLYVAAMMVSWYMSNVALKAVYAGMLQL